ncbi:hypothetical protein PMI07_000806 [Rhizobium sp. CF080]|uniref:ATP-dependent DNA helicase n=1 Tax=Rhizobium sp. (strain CF080) TaxID=1144310 RepID=UPI000271D60C|nr:ATP-dependent RecD-like DNA helicase [Rhizobium sp. CF080]EUB97230.1 hypothetical protein PMI07_000806 [Rhizobium sp. CF080]
MTQWSPQQNEALSLAGAWLRMRYKPTFYLSGYAGTGKTTLAMHLAEHVDGRVAFAAYTGKAASVMRQKGCKGARTIHSLIYKTEIHPVTGDLETTLREPDALDKFKLIVIDECSMVDEEVGKALLSFGKPVIVLGDPGQLPPVKGGGYFTEQKPDYLLTEVHRQAAESPIVWLATQIREGRFRGEHMNTDGLIVTDRQHLDPQLVTGANIVLVGRNSTRQAYNKRLRMRAGKEDPLPMKGEPLICLRNDKDKKISNGEIFEVVSRRALKKSVSLSIMSDDPDRMKDPIKVAVRKEFFDDDVEAQKIPFKELRDTQQFTYGYAITCHKSQGSQWQNVCVFDESSAFREDRDRWLYTAATRAAEHLTLVI